MKLIIVCLLYLLGDMYYLLYRIMTNFADFQYLAEFSSVWVVHLPT